MQHSFQREIEQKLAVRSGSDNLADSVQNTSLKNHTNSTYHYNQELPYSDSKCTSQNDTYLIQLEKHSQQTVDKPFHPDKSGMPNPSAIQQIVKNLVVRFIDLLVEGEGTIVEA